MAMLRIPVAFINKQLVKNTTFKQSLTLSSVSPPFKLLKQYRDLVKFS